MLVLTRKLGEKICIGAGITITVLDLAHGKVRLGIDAPKDVPILRAELNDSPPRTYARGNESADMELTSTW